MVRLTKASGKEFTANARDERETEFDPWEAPLEWEMVNCCSILVWKIPWTEKPVRPQSIGSQRLRHD